MAIGALAAFILKSTFNNDDIVVLKVKTNLISTSLSGAEKVPIEIDTAGTGFAELILNRGRGTITYTLSVSNLDCYCRQPNFFVEAKSLNVGQFQFLFSMLDCF